MTSAYVNARHLAEPDWLIAHLGDDDLRVIDARFDVRARTDGRFEEVPGRADYASGHIPGAQFVDLKSDLTDPQDTARIVGPDGFSTLMSRLGIGPRSTVVIYDNRGGAWAARLWWALRYYGHHDAKILNGGLSGWRAAGGDLQADVPEPAPAKFVATVQEHLRVTKEQVLTAIDTPAVRIVDALPAPFYRGQVGLYPGHRKGHVPSARNVPAELNLDPKTSRLKSMEALKDLWQDAAISPDHSVITYCGGGVFAAFALFVLVLMGHEKAALYDGSWQEWGCDESLPVETDFPTT